jgi:hypothetical protein
MDPLRLIVQERGVFTRGQAPELGYDDRAVAASLRGALWVRLRRGTFTFRDVWAAADPVGRHRLMARAAIASLGRSVALSHVTGAVENGLRTYGVDLSNVHVTRLDGGAGLTEAGVARRSVRTRCERSRSGR